MIHRIMVSAVIAMVGLLHLADASGNSATKKVQIHVPHSIQHHHHTHTKYHFITLPTRTNTNALPNNTTFPGILAVMPAMPLVPGLMQPATATTVQPPTPAPAVNPPPGIQTNALPAAGLMPQGIPVPMGQGPPSSGPMPQGFPVPMGQGPPSGPQQQQPGLPLIPVLSRRPAMYANNPGYYDYNDNFVRRSQKYYKVEAPPTPQPIQPMKFKTIINVHETKKIPLTDLLNIATFLQKEPPRRIKIEVQPEKSSHNKESHFNREEPRNAVHSSAVGSIQHYSIPATAQDGIHFDPETAAYQIQPRHEILQDKPEYVKVKELLEKHIQHDFPGLKIKAELVPIGPSSLKERSDVKGNAENKVIGVKASDLKHIGYVVISDNNDHKFVSLEDAQR